LRALRAQLHLSQASLAALIGVSSNTVARWERGELGMRLTTARLIEMIAAQGPNQAKPKKKE
jgi:DNA-binding transcriptional regulator YiaG